MRFNSEQAIKDLSTIIECLDKNVWTKLEEHREDFNGLLEAEIYQGLALSLDLVHELKDKLCEREYWIN